MNDVIQIILVDDEILFRKGISFLLERETNIEIVFEASNGDELISYLRSTKNHPDIIIMDLKMPILNGVEATKIIHKEFPEIKIIALTSYDSKSFVANMIDVGAVSYVIKNATPQELLTTVNEVALKGFYYTEYVMKIIQTNILNTRKTKSNFDSGFLSVRELEVLKLICYQKSTLEIAEQLFISPRTVEGHRNNLLLKTESRNIAGLVVYAVQNEIMPFED
ncbi:response regulator transcription factor [Flavobacterium sp. LS1P28]|uniref:Response regulator transcription factor n=1 Tax=Flavobacterium bomense TaxID=2497483 RepID=A0A432CNJ5_9FLAO|nr:MULTISPECIES: response regulator transcription factor [Flavobacterium]RTY65270.1 response regulator transcription factor [Flavobacterium sp. LB2P53]RTY74140.1 response regulator transcription factor [Flavobacterium sp. LS1R10]RTY83579.1 response regulator transcription factor [Flavobacterium sp. LS1P28]RTY83631.1 response regulator transcription factor [Flavobacterium sp. ZB4P23]RTY90980.1 response regulator transcription factor [Flavobacterium sp. RSP46]